VGGLSYSLSPAGILGAPTPKLGAQDDDTRGRGRRERVGDGSTATPAPDPPDPGDLFWAVLGHHDPIGWVGMPRAPIGLLRAILWLLAGRRGRECDPGISLLAMNRRFTSY
jgi:hypothetical protein